MPNEQSPESGSIEQFEPEAPTGVEETDEGGAIVQVSGEERDVTGNFYDNLVPDLEPAFLGTLVTRLLDDVDRDKQDRAERDKQYAEGIKRTGMGKEAPGGAKFEGASTVVHPVLLQACIDFAARAIRELMPPQGPVRAFVASDDPPPDRTEKAERKKKHMNYQFKFIMPEFRAELEQLLIQLPLGGSQYLRITPDIKRKRPIPVFVPSDDVLIPYAASNYYTAERVTFVERITQFEFNSRVRDGLYVQPNLGGSSSAILPEQTESQKATDKVEGAKPPAMNIDGLRKVYEITTFEILPDDQEPAPYRISVDDSTRSIVSIVRNWEEDDEFRDSMFWMVDFPFVPWRGAQSIGLSHMIGGLAGGATGALRALLDSALANTIPTLLKLKGTNFIGQTKEMTVGTITEIEGAIATDDIRKLIMQVPYNPPSNVLLELMGSLVDSATGVVRTTFDNLAEMSSQSQLPVGTVLSLIEEGLKTVSAVHLRLYHAMDYVIRIVHRINRMYLTNEDIVKTTGEQLAYVEDYDPPFDVVPVADPEIFTDVQRFAQLQVVAERAAAMPDLYDRRKVEERILDRTKIPNAKELLIPVPEPQDMNAVNENAALSLGRPVAAFPEQDHLGHLQVHLDFASSPFLGQLPNIAPKFLPGFLQHVAEHVVLWYVTETFRMLHEATGVEEDELTGILAQKDKDVRQELDKTLATISTQLMGKAKQVLASLPAVVQRAQQMMQQFAPPPQIPLDPNKQAAVQATREKTQADIQKENIRAQTTRETQMATLTAEQQRLAQEQAAEDARQSKDHASRLVELARKLDSEERQTAAELQSREKINVEDNVTALQIASAEIESGEKVAVENGRGINPSE